MSGQRTYLISKRRDGDRITMCVFGTEKKKHVVIHSRVTDGLGRTQENDVWMTLGDIRRMAAKAEEYFNAEG